MDEQDFQEMRVQIKEIHRALYVGNGHLPLMTRVDRLEQSEKRRSWVVRAAITAALSSLTATIWAFFVGGKP